MKLLSIERTSGFRVSGELDLSTAHELEDALQVTQQQGGAVLVDVSELTFADSTGIHALVQAAGRLRGRGCLILHGEQDRVRRVLDILGLDSIPNLHRIGHGQASTNGGEAAEWSGNAAGPQYAS